MPDREKVILGLEQCPKLPFVLCFTECTNNSCHYYGEDGIYELHENAIALLKEQPEIVRCKDCKWRGTYACFCKAMDDVQDDWFCSEGERK